MSVKNAFSANEADIIEMYVSGEPSTKVAKSFGISKATVLKTLRRNGVERRSKRAAIDGQAVVKMYESGVSEKATADRFGVSRSVISRILREHGADRRGRSEAETLKWSTMDAKARKRQVAKAHQAVREKPKEFFYRAACAQAKTKEKTLSKMGEHEAELMRELQRRGLSIVPQKAVGPYNIDLACGRTAVEVHVNPSNPHGHPYYRKRVVDLLERGWDVVYVKITSDISIKRTADKIVSLANAAKRNKSSLSQYWMIRGSGELVTEGRLDGDDLACVDATD